MSRPYRNERPAGASSEINAISRWRAGVPWDEFHDCMRQSLQPASAASVSLLFLTSHQRRRRHPGARWRRTAVKPFNRTRTRSRGSASTSRLDRINFGRRRRTSERRRRQIDGPNHAHACIKNDRSGRERGEMRERVEGVVKKNVLKAQLCCPVRHDAGCKRSISMMESF